MRFSNVHLEETKLGVTAKAIKFIPVLLAVRVDLGDPGSQKQR